MEDKTENEQGGKGGLGSLIFRLIPYILIIALGVFGGIFTAQQKPEWFGLSKGSAAVQAEVDALVAQVGKLISLPDDEKPTVATVTDASKVKDQPFFAKAQNGDKVLIYQKAAKAILYRPSTNMIVEVGAVNINNQAVSSPVPSPTAPAKVKSTPETTPVETPIATP
ncbi:MAG: hypothetical protein HYV90_05690 [Candidatus Woesebacteria bacterium]|nr:MAG: hypothetical protein HYV90_05690 [Candidatus Woesebacteria bacterium]